MGNNQFNKISVISIASFLIGYGALQAQVRYNARDIQEAKETPIKVAALQAEVKGLSKALDDFKTEQRQAKKEILDAIKNVN